jgi:hypothetical protein
VALFLGGGHLGYGLSQLVFTTVYRVTGGATAILLPISVAAAFAIARFIPAPAPRPLTLGAWLAGVRAAAPRLGLLFGVQVFVVAGALGLALALRPGRAPALARQAREDYARLPARTKDVGTMEAWLQRRPAAGGAPRR